MASVSAAELMGQVEALLAGGQLGEAEALAHRVIEILPRYSGAKLALARIYELTGRPEDAVRTYDLISSNHPGMGTSFTRRATLLLRGRFGEPPPPRARASKVAVTCSGLGVHGRFANQLLQYAVTRAYAEQHGIDAEFPDWVGRDLFQIDDPFLSAVLPPVTEQEKDLVGAVCADPSASLAGRDFQGFFCGETGALRPARDRIRTFFRLRPALQLRADNWRKTLPAHGTLVALHLRRGDFVGNDRFWIAPAEVYLDWLQRMWPSLDRPILYIATDDPGVIGTFALYRPVSAADLGPYLPGAEFLADFHILTQADRLAISNSSFSFVAAMLNDKAIETMRPLKGQSALMPFDPWNAPVLLDG